MAAQRKRAGPGLLLALLGGLLLLGANTADLFLCGPITADQPLRFTLRMPGIGMYRDTIESGGGTYQYLRRIYPRHSSLTSKQAELIRAVEERRRPPRPTLVLGMALAFVLTLFFFTRYSAYDSPEAGTLRTQAVLVFYLCLFVVGGKLLLLLTPYSAMWLPLSAVVVPVAHHVGRRTAAAASVAGAFLLSLHAQVDLPLLLVLAGQGLGAALASGAGRRAPVLATLGAAFGACAGGGAAYVAATFLLQQPLMDSQLPLAHQALTAALASGPAGAVLGLLFRPVLGFAMGIISRAKLHRLANLDAPLLKQLAARAPGTWAHSMTMANMAEMAANTIGGDGLLVRVGAYYHDLGKTGQPRYFIENQEGADNPHDAMAPDVSTDAIFSHVTEGVKLARKHKLPRPIIDFIYTHHGRALLEFFWHKNQQLGNPKNLDEDDFRYPGYPPQTRESAILSLCDAVEAASRTLEDNSPESIRKLVWQIALTKLDQTHFDESGLTLAELNRVMRSLVETLRSSHHGRIRYPWQQRSDETGPPAQGNSGQAAEESRERVHTRPLGSSTEDPP